VHAYVHIPSEPLKPYENSKALFVLLIHQIAPNDFNCAAAAGKFAEDAQARGLILTHIPVEVGSSVSSARITISYKMC
jgi:hypothetical protein